MDRRDFLKSILTMAGAACLGLVGLVPRMARLTMTDPKGRVTWKFRPIHIFLGAGEQFNPNDVEFLRPVWQRGAEPSLYFVNRRLQRPLVRFFAERWA